MVLQITGEFDASVKQAMEVLCLPHKVSEGKIIVEGEDAHAFAFCLGYDLVDCCELLRFQVSLGCALD